MASTFEYWVSKKDSQYWFHLKENGNRKIILASTEGYKSEQGCLNGIASTKANAPWNHNYSKFQGTDGGYYFTLKASNNEPVSRSEGYETALGRDRGIDNCKVEAPQADVKKLIT